MTKQKPVFFKPQQDTNRSEVSKFEQLEEQKDIRGRKIIRNDSDYLIQHAKSKPQRSISKHNISFVKNHDPTKNLKNFNSDKKFNLKINTKKEQTKDINKTDRFIWVSDSDQSESNYTMTEKVPAAVFYKTSDFKLNLDQMNWSPTRPVFQDKHCKTKANGNCIPKVKNMFENYKYTAQLQNHQVWV